MIERHSSPRLALLVVCVSFVDCSSDTERSCDGETTWCEPPSATQSHRSYSSPPTASSLAAVMAPSASATTSSAGVAGWTPIPEQRPGRFPGSPFAKVRAFYSQYENAEGKPVCANPLTRTGSLCETVERPGIELTDAQAKKLVTLLTTPSTYGGGSNCFAPHHVFVFYDERGVPIAGVSLCFECDMIQGWPRLDPKEEYSHGVSAAGIASFKAFCKEIGLGRCDK